MTGIFIPCMEVPSSCFLCPFVFHKFCYATSFLDSSELRKILKDGHVPGCPLVAVSFKNLNFIDESEC